jgi:hypothetical protein
MSTITLPLTTQEAEAVLHKLSNGPLSAQDERLLPLLGDRLLDLYQDAFNAARNGEPGS